MVYFVITTHCKYTLPYLNVSCVKNAILLVIDNNSVNAATMHALMNLRLRSTLCFSEGLQTSDCHLLNSKRF